MKLSSKHKKILLNLFRGVVRNKNGWTYEITTDDNKLIMLTKLSNTKYYILYFQSKTDKNFYMSNRLYNSNDILINSHSDSFINISFLQDLKNIKI